MDSSEITIDQERKEPWISLIVTKNKKEVENFFINVVLKDYELEPISDTSLAYFIEALDVNNKKSITINKHTTLDEFMNTYINHEYNSLYLYKKMTPDFEKMMKKRV